jgi:hypothetical protein
MWRGSNWISTRQFNGRRIRDKAEFLMRMGSQFTTSYDDRASFCIVEDVELWEGSLTSMTSAKRGDLFKLAGLAHTYIWIAQWNFSCHARLAPAREWKGNMRHEQVISRVSRYVDIDGMTEHEIDSVGIGLFALGLFNQGRRKVAI